MVHEIGHMFGIKHCVYYECTMNGSNSYDESLRMLRFLCPICHRKLHQAIGFKSQERFRKLLEICKELGFKENAAFYETVLKLIS